ncbi:MAG: DUF6134 family protein [Pseudomonadota bacterium]
MKPLIACLITFAFTLVAAISSAAASSVESGNSYRFQVLLDNKPIGFHHFDLTETEGGKKVESRARFDVKLLFITAFKYRHQSVENWRDDCLESIEASTNSNGKQQTVSAAKQDDVLAIDSNKGNQTVDGCVQTFAYWNPSILDATQLLNSQTGDYVDIDIRDLGPDTVLLGDTDVGARKYNIKSMKDYAGKPVDILIWYDETNTEWLALESKAKGDRVLRYERLDLLETHREQRQDAGLMSTRVTP